MVLESVSSIFVSPRVSLVSSEPNLQISSGGPRFSRRRVLGVVSELLHL